jgi:fibro-slime domain-containing protein
VRLALPLLFALAFTLGCASTTGASPDGGGAGTTGQGGAGGSPGLPPIPEDGYSMLPGDTGGYQIGAEEILAADIQKTIAATSSTTCNHLRGIVRDFKGALPAVGGSLQPGGHPDFEVFQGEMATTGLVAPDLPRDGEGHTLPDRKPVYASKCELGAPVSADCPFGAMTTSAANFNQWYRSIEDVNKTYYVYFSLASNNLGLSTFESTHFFPVDGTGFGNSGVDSDGHTQRNYSFTTEIHTTLRYNGGEVFTFKGDDDVWVFINGKLAVDLGGLHTNITGAVDLDANADKLGIQKGTVYPLDLFHAERHSQSSDFHIDMNFAFQDCGYIP